MEATREAMVKIMKVFLKADSLTDAEIELSLDDAKIEIEKNHAKFIGDDYALRLLTAHLLTFYGKNPRILSVNQDGVSMGLDNVLPYYSTPFLQQFNNYVGVDVVYLV